jgi:hypothetical protein
MRGLLRTVESLVASNDSEMFLPLEEKMRNLGLQKRRRVFGAPENTRYKYTVFQVENIMKTREGMRSLFDGLQGECVACVKHVRARFVLMETTASDHHGPSNKRKQIIRNTYGKGKGEETLGHSKSGRGFLRNEGVKWAYLMVRRGSIRLGDNIEFETSGKRKREETLRRTKSGRGSLKERGGNRGVLDGS